MGKAGFTCLGKLGEKAKSKTGTRMMINVRTVLEEFFNRPEFREGMRIFEENDEPGSGVLYGLHVNPYESAQWIILPFVGVSQDAILPLFDNSAMSIAFFRVPHKNEVNIMVYPDKIKDVFISMCPPGSIDFASGQTKSLE